MDDRQVLDPDALAGAAFDPDRADLLHPVVAADQFEGDVEFVDAAGGSRPFGQPHVVVGEPVQRAQDRHEGRRDLHYLAERHRAGQILRCCQQQRYDRGEECAGVQDVGQARVLDDDVFPASYGAFKGGRQALLLVGVSLDEGNRLRVLAHAGHLVAKLRLRFVLLLDLADERIADKHHKRGNQERIEDGGDGNVAGDRHLLAGQGNRDRTADREEDADEGDRRQQRVDEADGEIDDGLGCETDFVGEAVFGVEAFVVGDGEAIEALVVEPFGGELAGQPRAPGDLQRHPAAHHRGRAHSTHHDERGEGAEQRQQAVALFLLEAVEEQPVPVVDADADREGNQDQADREECPCPGSALFAAAPETGCVLQKAPRGDAGLEHGGSLRRDIGGLHGGWRCATRRR